MAEKLEVPLRPQDVENAQSAWQSYKTIMRGHPRRQLRKRELIAGYLAGVGAERSHQMEHVHPAIMQMQYLIDVSSMAPEAFEEMKRQNPEAVRRLRNVLNEWMEDPNA